MIQTKWLVASLVSIVLLLHRDGHATIAVAAAICTALFGKLTKACLRVQRPSNSQQRDYGMPSSHALLLFYFSAFACSALLLRGWRMSDSGVPVPLPRLVKWIDPKVRGGERLTKVVCGLQDPLLVRNVGDDGGERRSVTVEPQLCDELDTLALIAGPSAADAKGFTPAWLHDLMQVPAAYVGPLLAMPIVVGASAMSAWRVASGLHTPGQVGVGAALGIVCGVFGHWAATAERGLGRMVDTWMRGGDPWSLGDPDGGADGQASIEAGAPTLSWSTGAMAVVLALLGLALVGSVERSLCKDMVEDGDTPVSDDEEVEVEVEGLTADTRALGVEPAMQQDTRRRRAQRHDISE